MAETRSLEGRAPAERPLSPHLQIYRPMLTMMMSIVHRITGFGLYFGMLLLAWWLIAAASPNAYADFNGSPAPGSAGSSCSVTPGRSFITCWAAFAI